LLVQVVDPFGKQAVPASVGMPHTVPPPDAEMHSAPAQQALVPVPPGVQVVPMDRHAAI
jgi:hypothetical protein